jgi:putative transposase
MALFTSAALNCERQDTSSPVAYGFLEGELTMLNTAELEQYLNRQTLGDDARRMVDCVRNRETVIDLQRRQGANSIVLLYSRKMGNRHIAAQSRTLIAAAARWHEYDREVLEYYIEPHQVTLETRDEDDVVQNRAQHTFRFLVLGHEMYLEDWREESDLISLERKDATRAIKVGRFFRDEKGCWHDRDAEKVCNELGVGYRLRTSRSIPQRFLENIRFIQDYLDDRTSRLPEEIRSRLLDAVSERSVTFEELVSERGFSADELFVAISQEVVYINLFEDNLRDPEQLYLHRDQGQREVHEALRDSEQDQPTLPLPAVGILEPGTTLEYGEKNWKLVLATSGGNAEALFESKDGHQLVLATDEAERLVLEQGTPEQRNTLIGRGRRRTLFDLKSQAKESAVRKLMAVREGSGSFSRSTLTRARRIISESRSTIDALIALAGRHADKGSRAPRFPAQSEELAQQMITEHYNKPATGTSGAKAYDLYLVKSTESGLPHMSYVTFLKRLKLYADPLSRSGKRVAYRDGDIPLTLDIREPVHGLMPHEVLYCDHTLLNLATTGPQRQDWGKVWLSAGTDGHVPRARAMYLSYDPPSSMSVLMLLRDYVRRHGRLPRVIVVDGGKEFRCAAFTKLCSIFGIEIRYRGPGRPRGGAPIERMFGVTEQEFLSGLEGNTTQLKEARLTTKTVQPNLFRTWTFPRLYRALEHYLFFVRPEVVHPALGMTPTEYEAFRIEQTGHRKHVSVAFDENFLLLTCPTPTQLMHKVYPHRGIWESGRFYWHSEFSRLAGRKLEVRTEPWCANVIYVYTERRWEVAIVRNVAPYRGRTRYEVNQALREEKRKNQAAAAHERRSLGRAKRMVEMLDPLNFSDTVAHQQQVMAAVYSTLGMTTAMTLTGIAPLLPSPPAESVHDTSYSEDAHPIGSVNAEQVPHTRPDEDASETKETHDEETAFI